ncbi:type I restriction endonuclease subunit R, EcoR124 family [Bombilactobacillus bombi]|uniref:type I restriction endonuclease subunit R, EcoR124 family n=1 Tax=Bombilactobacillus bombi TaxID=1303590 RepID=UPI0015E5E3E2|nr:HsdR family type I site-specific deoxyribonuclease [Bombilactobacillus bombi]MBA1433862.1 type I restriction endonuclease subunit R [Bombilactobacillus bombi]
MEEAAMEEKLIDRLTQGVNQWVRREDLKTVPQLWDNFFKILTANNQDQLADAPLTANEQATIRTQLVQPSFYRAAQFLMGANRQVRFHLQRDDSNLPDADLLILDNTNITGGSSVYEIAHQVQVPRTLAIDQDRRFDVTLLINGLPLIQIELKTPQQPYMKAFHQLQKYIDEGKFTDLYCFVQMLVVTNGTSTRYISAGPHLNAQFLTSWVNQDNSLVDNYLDFAQAVLNIPAAHKMIADYTVLDSEAKKIILLRPYQIHAIQAIFEASRQGQSGFVWHTTGSGKTLTSYKVARNLLQIPSLQKTIFLIDRKDLDMQTTAAFQAYANNDTINVNETNNSYDLAEQLGDGDRNVVVTTRQKLQAIFKRIDDDSASSQKYASLRQLHLAFIVDECHRAVTPAQKRELDKFFVHPPLWYGFTGTPIFSENARKENGQEARTTEQLYGPVLHKYTIEDAIRDQAVLGFKIDNQGSAYQSESDEANTEKMDSIYLQDPHMRSVVEQVLALAYRKQGLINGHRYSGIFTTSSIKQAQKYYTLFRQVIAAGGVSQRILKVAPDFPRIAITYSISQNDTESEANQEQMKQSLKDYNQMFGTNFTMSELDAYNRNVNDRLARKKRLYQQPGAQLDLVIVVDRLLTGFDSPNLAALYLDRPPLNPQNLIQAFSRTNRIFDAGKTWGQIVTFQYPETYSTAIDDALRLYSNGGTATIMAPDWATSRRRFKKVRQHLDKYLRQKDDLTQLLKAPVTEQKQFVKDFQEYDKSLTAIQTYDELDHQDQLEPEERVQIDDIDPDVLAALRGTYENVVEQLHQNNSDDPDDSDIVIDDEYELESFHTKEVDERYIMALIQAYIPEHNEQELFPMDTTSQEKIDTYIDDLAQTNQPLADIIRSLWRKVQQNPQDYTDQQMDQVLESLIDQESQQIMQEFAQRYQVDYDDLRFVMTHYDPDADISQQKGMNKLVSKGAFQKFKAAYPTNDLTHLLQWKKQVRHEVVKYYFDKIQPLIQHN